jgi:hypothetical protein
MYLCLAALTSELRDIAMELSQQLRANSGTQVEVIHILGDEEFQLTQILQFDNRLMAGIGLDRSKRSGFWWKSLFLSCPDAIRPSKIGKSGLRADSRARENDEVFGFEHPMSELLDSLV